LVWAIVLACSISNSMPMLDQKLVCFNWLISQAATTTTATT